MPVAAAKPASYEDLLRLPDNVVGEIVDGELYASPRPATPHALACTVLGSELGLPFHRGRGGPGGWWILFEPELHLGSDVIVPDLAGWRRERLPRLPSVSAMTLAPDWVCEVVSASTERLDRVLKLNVYAREGVAHLWFVNPTARTLEVLRLDGPRWTLLGTFANDAVVRVEPFEAIELDLIALWGETRTNE